MFAGCFVHGKLVNLVNMAVNVDSSGRFFHG